MDDAAAPLPEAFDATGATPVMAQFFEAKSQQPDALVFFRMGDFYELFFEDAVKASAALGIALTARGQHNGGPIQMCGVPVHAAEAYLAKLIRSGFKVAVCEQMESPAEARKRGSKSIVRRALVRVVTPGTLTEDSLLDARGSNRLAALAVRAGTAAVASVDISTGDNFLIISFSSTLNLSYKVTQHCYFQMFLFPCLCLRHLKESLTKLKINYSRLNFL